MWFIYLVAGHFIGGQYCTADSPRRRSFLVLFILSLCRQWICVRVRVRLCWHKAEHASGLLLQVILELFILSFAFDVILYSVCEAPFPEISQEITFALAQSMKV